MAHLIRTASPCVDINFHHNHISAWTFGGKSTLIMSYARHMSEDQFTKLFKYMEKRFDGVDERFEAMDDKFSARCDQLAAVIGGYKPASSTLMPASL